MRIHHVTIPAYDPERVARVLAELFGARVIPIPHPPGCQLVYAGDTDGTVIEVWPASIRGAVGQHQMEPRNLPLPEDWAHHAYVTTDASDGDRILAVFAREGWTAERVSSGPPQAGFTLVRGWIENQTAIEIGDSAMREQYERFYRAAAARVARS